MSSSYDSALVDTAMIEDARLLTLPRGIRLVHLEAMVWSKLRRTDGLIPAGGLTRLTDEPNPQHAASELVRVGLWEQAAGGWQIVGFADTQMSAKRIRAYQEAARKRYDDWRSNHPEHPKGKRSNAVANGASNGPARLPAPPARKGRGQDGGGDAAGLEEPAAAAPQADLTHVACEDFRAHQLHHRLTAEGWVCEVCRRRELGRIIREAPTKSMRERYRRAFDRSFGQLYPRAGM